jgi:putative ABC transport system permease protein
MSWLRRLTNTLRPAKVQRDIDREQSFHLAERADQLRSEGLSADEARRRARIRFGNPMVQRERTLDMDIAGWLDTSLRNIRHAVRSLARTPGFTATAVLTLAVGIGANTAVFSAIDAILLEPLSFPEGDRLMRVRQIRETEASIAAPRLEDWRRMSTTFEALTGYYVEDVSDTTADLPERLRRAVVAPRFLDVWGIAPALGRGFTDTEYRSGEPSAVVISDRYWRRRFAANPNVLDSTVRIDGRPHSIVGVMPASFRFPVRDVDIWWPYPVDGPSAQNNAENRQLQWYTGIGRLKPGVTLEQARADLAIVQAQLGEQYPATDAGMGVRIVPLKDTVVGGVRASLWLLFGAVSVLLVIACTNIAALLLSRAARREHEVAVRFSLGASRATVAVQLLTETAVLAFSGATVGLLVASGASTAFQVLAPDLPRLSEIGINARILMWTMASAIVVALLCGLLPAVRTASGVSSLTRAGRSPGAMRHSLQWLLVGVQVALSVMLLAGAGLLVRSVEALSRVDPGFDPSRILAFRVSGNWNEHYEDPGGLLQRTQRTLDELGALPGVEAAATSWTLPGAPGPFETEFEPIGGRSASEPPLIAAWRTVSPGYFETMRISLVGGDLCRSQMAGIHRPESTMDMMVNRKFADRYFPRTSAIGVVLAWDSGSLSGRVVGIVGDARELGIDRDTVPTVYACDSAPNPFPWFIVRTSSEPATMAATVRQRLKEVEPLRSVYDLMPLDQRIGDAYAQNRLRTVVLVLFAVTALSLACLGVYGTLSYVVSLRRREVGLRLALGAARTTIIRQFLRQGLRVAGVACACGLTLSLAFTRLLAGMLYGVSPADPATLSSVVAIVMTVAALAALVPAARAALVEPMRSLRE